MKMLRTFGVSPLMTVLMVVLAVSAAAAADHGACKSEAGVRQQQATLGISFCAIAAAGSFRLAEGPGRGCAENCVAQCRAAQSGCSGNAASCRAQFQICARRCVVSCSSR
jgi:hypothetical protein